MAEVTPQQMADMMASKVDPNDPCWSEFNNKHRYYQFLVDLARISTLFKPADVPEEPIPSDNPTLDC